MQGSTDLGKLVLRVVLGGLILFHGIAKLVHGPGYVIGMLASAGLPTILAYGV
jgi:putative oxidoreductase